MIDALTAPIEEVETAIVRSGGVVEAGRLSLAVRWPDGWRVATNLTRAPCRERALRMAFILRQEREARDAR